MLGLYAPAFAEPPARPPAIKVSKFSGEPVPRFASLRYSMVRGRQGPTIDHKVLWLYEKQGLPLLIIRETHGWRRVRDPDGDEVWVQSRMLSDERHLMVITDTLLHTDADQQSPARAQLKAGLVAELIRCEAAWCRVKVSGKTGWLQQSAVWGTVIETGGL